MKNRLVPSFLDLAPFFGPIRNPLFMTIVGGGFIWFIGWGFTNMMGNYATHTLMDALQTIDCHVAHMGQATTSWRSITYQNIILKNKKGDAVEIEEVILNHPGSWFWWGKPSHVVIRGAHLPNMVNVNISDLITKAFKKHKDVPYVQEVVLENCQIESDKLILHGWAKRLPPSKNPREDNGDVEGRFYGQSATCKQFTGALFVASRFTKLTVVAQDAWQTTPVGTFFFDRAYETFTWHAHKTSVDYALSGKTRQLFKHMQGGSLHPDLTLQCMLDIYANKYVGKITAIDDVGQAVLGTLYMNISKNGEGILQVHAPPREWSHWVSVLPAISLPSAWRYVKGKVGVTGILSPTAFLEPLRGNIVVTGKDVDIEGPQCTIDGLSGELILSQVWPRLESPTQQKISIRHLRFPAFDIDHAEVFLLNREGLTLKTVYGNFLGGRISLSNFRQEGENLFFQGMFRAVHPGHLLRREKITALDIIGHFSGPAQMIWSQEKIEISSGHFTLSSPEISLHVENEDLIGALFSDHLATVVPEKNRPLTDQKMAFDALKNLRCTIFTLDITPAHNKQSDIRLKIVGFNPTVLNGYPFEYIIETNGAFSNIARHFLLEKLAGIEKKRPL